VDSSIAFNGIVLPYLSAIRVDFKERIDLLNLSISQSTNFSNCHFRSNTNFSSINFRDSVVFQNNGFDQTFYSSTDTFRGPLDFSGNHFRGLMFFERNYFKNEGKFLMDSFFGGSLFRGSQFYGPANFSVCYFKSLCSFQNCIFFNDASFTDLSVPGLLDFTNATFMGNVDFSKNHNISSRIDLTLIRTDTGRESTVKKRRGLNLTNSDVSKFKLDYSRFYLIFDTSASFEYRSNVYQSMLNIFKNEGYTESYELLDKDYKAALYDHKGDHFRGWLDKYWWDFGYSRHYIFYWTFGFLFFFTIVNMFFYPFLNREVYSIKDVQDKFIYRRARWVGRRFYYSLVYTSIIFFSLSVKLDRLRYRYWGGVIYIFIIYVLGLICIAYMANFLITR